MVKISPSLLSADFTNLHTELKKIEEGGADLLHLDIMDGHYVPNITFGAGLIKQIRKITKLPFDAHLMVENPDDLLAPLADAGCDYITVHPETCKHLNRTIANIKKMNMKAGIALLPSDNPALLKYIINDIDLILIMSVNPGFGGQEFLSNQLPKIVEVKNLIKNNNLDCLISVDGGVSDLNSKEIINAGADILVAGSYIFKGDYSLNIARLKNS